MNRLKRKLHSCKGETLVEVLVSVLVSVLSIAMLFGGIMVSVRIDEKAEQTDDGFYETLSAAEEKEDGLLGSGTAVVSGDDIPLGITFDVKFYGGETLYSYRIADEGGEADP